MKTALSPIEPHVSPFALRILHRLKEGGFAAFLVGGMVRDALWGIPNTDIDIATSATPEEIAQVFANYGVRKTGRGLGTVTVVSGEAAAEITTFRRESGVLDHRHPQEVCFTDSIEEDLHRRDFTINAIAWNPWVGVIDPFGGCEDLRRRRLRAVGHPRNKMGEDALRMLRAIRFCSVYALTMDGSLRDAVEEYATDVRCLSPERIFSELDRSLCMAAGMTMEWMFTLGISKHLFPTLDDYWRTGDERFRQHQAWVDALPSERTLRWAALLKPLSTQRAEEIYRCFHRSTSEQNAFERMIALPRVGDFLPTREFLRLLFEATGGEVEQGIAYYEAESTALQNNFEKHIIQLRKLLDEIRKQGSMVSRRALSIRGSDLIAMGYPEGRRIGDALERLYRSVWAGDVSNDREILKAMAYQWLKKSCSCEDRR